MVGPNPFLHSMEDTGEATDSSLALHNEDHEGDGEPLPLASSSAINALLGQLSEITKQRDEAVERATAVEHRMEHQGELLLKLNQQEAARAELEEEVEKLRTQLEQARSQPYTVITTPPPDDEARKEAERRAATAEKMLEEAMASRRAVETELVAVKEALVNAERAFTEEKRKAAVQVEEREAGYQREIERLQHDLDELHDVKATLARELQNAKMEANGLRGALHSTESNKHRRATEAAALLLWVKEAQGRMLLTADEAGSRWEVAMGKLAFAERTAVAKGAECAEKSRAVEELTRQAHFAQESWEALQKQHADATQSRAEARDRLETESAEAKETIAILRGQLANREAALKQTRDEAREAFESAREDAARRQHHLDGQERRIQEVCAELRILRSEMEQKAASLADTEAALREARTAANDAQGEAAKASETIAKLTKSLEEVMAEKATLQKKLGETLHKLSDTRVADLAEERARSAQQELATKKQEYSQRIAEAERKAAAADFAMHRMQQEMKDREQREAERREAHKAQIRAEEERSAAAGSESTRLQVEVTYLTKAKLELESRLREAETALQTATADREIQKRELESATQRAAQAEATARSLRRQGMAATAELEATKIALEDAVSAAREAEAAAAQAADASALHRREADEAKLQLAILRERCDTTTLKEGQRSPFATPQRDPRGTTTYRKGHVAGKEPITPLPSGDRGAGAMSHSESILPLLATATNTLIEPSASDLEQRLAALQAENRMKCSGKGTVKPPQWSPFAETQESRNVYPSPRSLVTTPPPPDVPDPPRGPQIASGMHFITDKVGKNKGRWSCYFLTVREVLRNGHAAFLQLPTTFSPSELEELQRHQKLVFDRQLTPEEFEEWMHSWEQFEDSAVSHPATVGARLFEVQ
eukprot:Sspe_Gene.42804::Locus_20828_Transcript_1_1_Confidence_1.000_Length_2758::g.42804::m.42804